MKHALLIMGVLAVASGALADNREAARRAFGEGTRLYDIADFKSALEAFKRAYLNYEDPSLLFNIAQCYRQLDDKPEAIRFYRTYVRKAPRAPNVEEARRLIAGLEAAMAKTAAAPHAAPSPELPMTRPTSSPQPAAHPAAVAQPAPASEPLIATSAPAPNRRPVYKKWWFWTATVLAAGAAATAIGVGVTEGRAREPSFQVHAP